MTSAAQIAANRRNARRATGPRSPAGKARAARNALRHGLTARVVEGTPAAARVAELTAAILQDYPSCDTSRALTREVAEAQRTLELVRLHRLSVTEAAGGNSDTYREPLNARDINKMCAVMDAHDKGRLRGGRGLERLLIKIRRGPPPQRAARLAEVYSRLQKSLTQLERYESRALSRRRRALEALDGFTGQPSAGQAGRPLTSEV